MKRVLAIRLSAMGDVVQSLGAVRSLASARPDLELHFVVQREFVPLLDGLDYVASVIPHDRRPAVIGYLGTARRLRQLAPDVALDLQGNWKSAGIARLSGARERVGSIGALRREPRSRVLLNRHVGQAGDSQHPAALALQVVRVLAPDAERQLPELVASDAEIEAERAALRDSGIDPSQPFRVLVLGAPRDPRSWRPAAMLREQRAGGLPCVWLAGPAEREVGVPGGALLLRHEKGQLRRLVALGRTVGLADGEIVGPDLGAVHVLAATGARTVALFGPHAPDRTGPPAARAVVAQAGPSCRPCRERVCRHPDGPVCMDFTLAESAAIRDD